MLWMEKANIVALRLLSGQSNEGFRKKDNSKHFLSTKNNFLSTRLIRLS